MPKTRCAARTGEMVLSGLSWKSRAALFGSLFLVPTPDCVDGRSVYSWNFCTAASASALLLLNRKRFLSISRAYLMFL